LRLCGRGFVRSPRLRVRRQRPWGSDGAFGLGFAALEFGRSVSGPAALSGHNPKLSAFPDSGKLNRHVDNEDNGGKFNLDQVG